MRHAKSVRTIARALFALLLSVEISNVDRAGKLGVDKVADQAAGVEVAVLSEQSQQLGIDIIGSFLWKNDGVEVEKG